MSGLDSLFFIKLASDFRRELLLQKRRLVDTFSGKTRRFANSGSNLDFPLSDAVELIQPVPRTTHSENKIKNILIASEIINQTIIHPDEIFSFWHLVGRPAHRRGFREGRMLIRGKTDTEIGGGLCQLSGLLYHLSLLAGLEVLERHAHSVDIYREEERFTPLGADAAVVFGRKDLRVENRYHFPIRFKIHFQEDSLTGRLESREKLQKRNILFNRNPLSPQFEEVQTYFLEAGKSTMHRRAIYARNLSPME